MNRQQAIRAISSWLTDELVVSCNGLISRELASAHDRPGNFYMLGSMGLASSIALGVSKASQKKVVAIEGDGNLLMNLNTLATIATEKPGGFTHIVLDNNVYESTGGQGTRSSIGLDGMAKAAGYMYVARASDVGGLIAALDGVKGKSPAFVLAKIDTGGSAQPRVPLPPQVIRDRFSKEAGGLHERDSSI